MKPKEIVEIEKELKIKLLQMNEFSFKQNNNYLPVNTFVQNDENRTIGLDISRNRIVNTFFLEKLQNLEYLNFSQNQVTDILGVKKLKYLKKLDFWGNNVSDISALVNLTRIELLLFRSNKVINISTLKKIVGLKRIDFSGNNVLDITALANLTNLQSVDFGANNVSYIAALANLTNLQSLDFSGNNVSDITALANLTNLQFLDIRCNQVNNLFPLLKMKSLKMLKLAENPNIQKTFPQEIVGDWEHNCLPALRSYLTDLELGKSPNNEVKTILIGNGSVGKTQIARRLSWDKKDVFELNEKHDSTYAIDLHKKNLKCSFLENGLDLNIWDFGGQDIYHATHHLFMQTRALFILVWDAENEKEDSQHEYKGVKYDNFPLRYWLEYAKYFGKESLVLVVRNKTDIHGKEFEMPKGLKESYQTEYPNVVGFVEVSAKTGENF